MGVAFLVNYEGMEATLLCNEQGNKQPGVIVSKKHTAFWAQCCNSCTLCQW